MPTFNVITINEKHLAKVNAEKKKCYIDDDMPSSDLIWSFERWRKYIKNQLKSNKALTSIVVEHIYD